MMQLKIRSIIALLVLLGGLVAVIVGFTVLPHATVTLEPATNDREVSQEITLTTANTEPDFKRFILPTAVLDTEFTQAATIKREGGHVQESFATGTVTLVNQQNDEQPLLPKTHLRHEATGIMFLTDQAVRIPVQGETSVSITAKEAGAAGNVSAGKFIIDKLPANLQSSIFGQSGQATNGGEVFDTPISEAEINQSKDAVRQQALANARGELTAKAGGAAIRDDLIFTTVEEITASIEPGSRATSFEVTAKVRQRAFVVDEQDLLALTLLALRASPSADEDFVSFNPESFSAELLKADFDRGDARIRGSLTGTFARKTESSVFDATKLAGRTKIETEEYFRQFQSVRSATVKLSPFWVNTIPGRASAVDIVMKQSK